LTLKALLIDLDNTLIDRDQAVRKFCTALFHKQNWDACQIEPAVEALMVWDDRGYADRNAWAARVCELAKLDESEFWSQFRSRVPGFITPDPDITQLLRSWSKKYRVAIVTNGTSSLQRAKLAATGLSSHFSISTSGFPA
jgi:putative hydrolase of the HAD superfamily